MCLGDLDRNAQIFNTLGRCEDAWRTSGETSFCSTGAAQIPRLTDLRLTISKNGLGSEGVIAVAGAVAKFPGLASLKLDLGQNKARAWAWRESGGV